MLYRAGITAGKNEGLAVYLLNGNGEIGALFLDYFIAANGVIPTAGLSAHTAVSVTADYVVGEQAAAAVRHAH